jgi:hypothetical protein
MAALSSGLSPRAGLHDSANPGTKRIGARRRRLIFCSLAAGINLDEIIVPFNMMAEESRASGNGRMKP